MSSSKSYFLVCLTAMTVFTACLYLLAVYNDSEIRFLRTYMLRETDGDYTTAAEDDPRLVRARKLRESGVKTVLLWNTMFGDRDFYFGEGDVFRGCPVNRCKISNDRDYLRAEDYDAILFHGNELHEVPARRHTGQLYVYVNLESPANRRVPRVYDNYFNLTMTYRLDSDIPWTYGAVEDAASGEFIAPSRDADWSALGNAEETVEQETPATVMDVVGAKSKLVTWFVSNCRAKSGRLEYVKELSKHIGVDIYGDCGPYRCNKATDCFRDTVEPNYFFYLSFENSFCDDYVTEKLMNPLRYNVVPVVYGGANYSHFVPPNSYVNALDFASPKDLAAHLKYLARDPRRYRSLLRWKKYYRIGNGTRRAVCTLCKVLHKRNRRPRTYTFLSDWYARNRCPIQTLLSEADEEYATKVTLTRKRA